MVTDQANVGTVCPERLRRPLSPCGYFVVAFVRAHISGLRSPASQPVSRPFAESRFKLVLFDAELVFCRVLFELLVPRPPLKSVAPGSKGVFVA